MTNPIQIWIDAQLSPSLALWMNENYPGLTACSLQSLGLREAPDQIVFTRARESGAVIMTKDDDFVRLQEAHGFPPPIILVTCGNSSNARMRDILTRNLVIILDLIRNGEPLIEISD